MFSAAMIASVSITRLSGLFDDAKRGNNRGNRFIREWFKLNDMQVLSLGGTFLDFCFCSINALDIFVVLQRYNRIGVFVTIKKGEFVRRLSFDGSKTQREVSDTEVEWRVNDIKFLCRSHWQGQLARNYFWKESIDLIQASWSVYFRRESKDFVQKRREDQVELIKDLEDIS